MDDTKIMHSRRGEMKIRVWEEGRMLERGWGNSKTLNFFVSCRVGNNLQVI